MSTFMAVVLKLTNSSHGLLRPHSDSSRNANMSPPHITSDTPTKSQDLAPKQAGVRTRPGRDWQLGFSLGLRGIWRFLPALSWCRCTRANLTGTNHGLPHIEHDRSIDILWLLCCHVPREAPKYRSALSGKWPERGSCLGTNRHDVDMESICLGWAWGRHQQITIPLPTRTKDILQPRVTVQTLRPRNMHDFTISTCGANS